MAGNVIVRALELDGRWVSIGSDSARGIVVEGLQADIDEWGPRAASFTLRRRTDVPWPDIGALTPIEIEDQGILVWSGRVKGTPTTDGADRQISVNAEGYQYHLDDDSYQKNYVQSRLTDFVDARSQLATLLGPYPSVGQVTVGDGVISLGFGNGVPYNGPAYVGVSLDFGEALCQHVAVNWTSSFNTGGAALYCVGGDVADGGGSSTDIAFSFALNTATASFNTGTFAAPHRYVHLFVYWSGGPFTPVADIWARIIPPTSFFASTAYASGGYSILKSSDVILDAVTRATMLLSDDTSRVQATSFSLPEFAMSQLATPREAIDAVNAFHSWQARVDVEKRIEYRPRPSAPVIQVDARSTFDEASAGDSTEIYSNVAVTYTDAAGQAQASRRGQTSSIFVYSDVQPTNPGAEVNTTGWTNVGAGALSRTTVGGEFSAGVAGFKLVPSGSGMQYASTASWSGSFVSGTTYRLVVDRRVFGGASGVYVWVLVDGVIVAAAGGYEDNTFHALYLDWVQPSNSAPEVRLQAINFGGIVFTVYFDNLVLYEGAATLVNRRHFRRTKVLATNMALTPAGAEQIGDRFLEAHRTTPLKGKVVVTGLGTARANPSGASMRTSELLLCGGELVRLAHLIDPDTGAIGREGRIASVGWDAESDTATLELDSQSQNLEAMLSRLALITGQVPA